MVPSESGPAGLVIRPEHPDDFEAIDAVVAEAFGSPAEAELVRRIRASPEYVADMALVAELGGNVVGHTMISGAVVVSQGERGDVRTPIVMLSPLAVAPSQQRRGIGGALVDAATAIADGRGEPFVVLEGSPAYYPRLGFTPAAERGLTLPIPDWAPPEAAQVKVLSSDRPDEASLRGTVEYPAAFAGLD